MNRQQLIVLAFVAAALLLLGGGAIVRQLSKSELAREQRLIPAARDALERLRAELAAQGIETFVGSTRRTEEEQAAKVAAGVSSTNNSWHLLGRAVDLYPIDPATKKPDMDGKHVDLFRAMHAAATRHGWRGIAFNPDGTKRTLKNAAGKPYWDGPHLEFPEGMTFAQAKAKGAIA